MKKSEISTKLSVEGFPLHAVIKDCRDIMNVFEKLGINESKSGIELSLLARFISSVHKFEEEAKDELERQD